MKNQEQNTCRDVGRPAPSELRCGQRRARVEIREDLRIAGAAFGHVDGAGLAHADAVPPAERREGELLAVEGDAEARAAQAERLADRNARERRAAERDALDVAAVEVARVDEPTGRVVRKFHVRKRFADRVRRHGGAGAVAVVQHVGRAGHGLQVGIAVLRPHVFIRLRAAGRNRKEGRFDRLPLVQELLPGDLGANGVEPRFRIGPAVAVERGEVVVGHIDLLFRTVAGEIGVVPAVLQAPRAVEGVDRDGLRLKRLVRRVQRHLTGQRAVQEVGVRHGENLRPRLVVDAEHGVGCFFRRRGGGGRGFLLRRPFGCEPEHERAQAEQQVQGGGEKQRAAEEGLHGGHPFFFRGYAKIIN